MKPVFPAPETGFIWNSSLNSSTYTHTQKKIQTNISVCEKSRLDTFGHKNTKFDRKSCVCFKCN